MRFIVKSVPENFVKEQSDLKNNTFRSLDGKDKIEVVNSETGESFERVLRDITIWKDQLIFTWEPVHDTKTLDKDICGLRLVENNATAEKHHVEVGAMRKASVSLGGEGTKKPSSLKFSKKKCSWKNNFVSERNMIAGDLMKKEKISWPDALKKASKMLRNKPKKKSWIEKASARSMSKCSFDNDYMARVNSDSESTDSRKFCVLCKEMIISDNDICDECESSLKQHSKVKT